MAEDLKPLMIERGTVKAALTRFKTFICKFATTTSVGSLKKRLDANVCPLDNFNRVQTRIEILVAGTDAEAAHAIEREEFESAYFDLIDQVEIVIARATPEQSRITTNSPISAQTTDTAINGVAARVIQALGVSGTNYRHAWELLKSRYEDSTSLKRHHVNSLLDLKSIQRESDITLREFLDEATNHRIALMSLGESVETWDTMLVPLLSRKLGQVSMKEWERRIISQSEMPTFGQLSAFIEERSKYLSNIAVSVQVAAPRVDQRPRGTNNTPRYNYIASHVVNSAGCPACKANHAIYNCEKFKNSDLNTKTKIVQEARLCFNCLSSGHRVRACTRSHCKQCGRKHHSLLHNSEFKRAEEGYAATGESDSREPPVLTANVANTIGHAVLSTAIVYVKDKGYQSHKCRIHREKIEIPSHIELADPEFHLQRPIDMLIGAGLFWTLLCVGQHKSTSNLLLQKTQLATLNDLQSQLERFWDIEELTPSDTRLIDECEAHFRETMRRDTDGRYIVRIPFKSNVNELAQIFDPLGLISPIVIVAKLILQLWQTQIGWDQSIPQNLHSQWLQYRQDISKVGAMNISRCAISECLDDIELHEFSDASEKAYGACVYLRSRDLSDSWVTCLLCAKSKVAPLSQNHSITEIRIMRCIITSKCSKQDSTITLAWLRSSPNKWKTFVANRVSQIQGLTSSDSWRHVASEDNPADLISRGTKPGTLQNTTIWWDGPTWLRQSSSLWPSALDHPIDVPEEKERKPVMLTISAAESSIVRRFSTYTRLLRSIAYCLRFAKIMRNRVKKLEGDASGSLITGPLTTIEINAARTRLELLAQREAFSTEIRLVQTQQALPNSSALRSLNVFLDNGGLLRVGGRLSNAPIDYDQKHSIILPPKHPLTDLIIKCEHHRLLHAGCQAVLTSLQTRYWLVSAKHNVKRNIRKCVRCFKTNPLSQTYQMSQLPASRVTPARPFFTCGVDYTGPFFTKERTRSKVTVKAYLCILVCFVTKTVHLELATDLSTDAFINCFWRFIARQGRCHCIISDNGTNFIGARNELVELNILIKDKQHNEKIANALSQESIEWRLIPPHSPHFGGLWEGAVKSAKYHLTRVIGDQRLTFEELYTLLTQIESCLNSRPLSPLSSDPTDLNPLTPGHFLIGTAITTLPSHDLRDIKVTRPNS
ncbi:uncharacterized protein LOC143260621 [Megalopta genalis]|uniref:uncharacterized protein LOC143260621 n=1 Tax=Megalopta genalis TaxID=115081 RepID=UPI003FD5C580